MSDQAAPKAVLPLTQVNILPMPTSPVEIKRVYSNIAFNAAQSIEDRKQDFACLALKSAYVKYRTGDGDFRTPEACEMYSDLCCNGKYPDFDRLLDIFTRLFKPEGKLTNSCWWPTDLPSSSKFRINALRMLGEFVAEYGLETNA